MKLSVIIVNYNVKYFVEQCLDSLNKALTGIESEIFVVDNHSKDESITYLKSKCPTVKFIESNHNLGFAKANNIAIKQSIGEYVLLLNPDTFVTEDSIAKALYFMDNHVNAGGAGLKMYNSDGTLAKESRRGLPTPLTAFYKMIGLCSRFPKNRILGKYYMGYLSWDEPAKIEVISGAFFLLRRSALETVGLLDEEYFMYGEDIDLSYRLLKGGFENWYLPLSILHYKGESTHKSSFKYVHVFYQAMFIFFKKHFGHKGVFMTLPIKIAIYIRAFCALVNMLSEKVRRSLGFVDRRHGECCYIFIGEKLMLEKCALIAKRRGLRADFFEVNDELLKKGHDVINLTESESSIVVYDTQCYNYKDILSLISSQPSNKISLGTFNSNTGIIITHKEILQ